jgi:hypothetical protein
MNKNEIKGKVQRAKGAVKEKAGQVPTTPISKPRAPRSTMKERYARLLARRSAK